MGDLSVVLQTAAAGLERARRRSAGGWGAAVGMQNRTTDAGSGARVLLLDPVMVVRRALADLLRLRLEGVAVCEAAEPASALTAVAEWRPTVVVAELREVEAFISQVHAVDPELAVLVVSAAFHPGTLPADGRFGAYRSLPKGDVEGLLTAIHTANANYQRVERR